MKLCRVADKQGEMWKVEYVMATKVYIPKNGSRVDPGHNGLQVFAGTSEHESRNDNAHIAR